MKEWQKISYMLCVFGFVRELRPSEPYIAEYLVGEWRNITAEQVNRDIFPWGTYSYLAQLVIVFLITDYLRYKPIIVVIGLSGTIAWSLLIWTTSLLALQIEEIFFGLHMASEIAYYTYIYAKVDKKHYSKVTSHTRAAITAGKMVAGILAQLLLNFRIMDYKDLNYISLPTQILSTFLALALPKVTTSLYFHRPGDSPELGSRIEQVQRTTNAIKGERISPGQLLWSHFKNAYTNTKVLQWSIWYALGLCGQLQIIVYAQVLWKSIQPHAEISWNGAVEAIMTGAATIFALAAGYMHGGRMNSRTSLLVLAFISILEGIVIFASCWTQNIIISYSGYIVFGALFAITITVASTEVARHLEEESYGLVFGINTTMALLLQTLLTLIVVSENGFALSAVGQFIVYAAYFVAIGVICLIFIALTFLRGQGTFDVVT